MASCIFCEIGAGRIPAQVVYSSPDVTAFRDINPQAPTHVLVIPNRHVTSVAEIGAADAPLLARLFEVSNALARQEGLAEEGYRIVTNCGSHGGQTVPHLHLHLLGGRQMTWPPG
ncbi:MAG TPA: histidine triad nucleotide-binding protein [Chloroflexota bacterium]|nr:histidine triad nucleotide-binding protein [Chloroflexota bacterium]